MRPQTERDYHERMLRVLVHIQQHLDESIPLEELASVANFSPFHFHRVFRGMVGESVKGHVRRLRLERAAYRLKFGDAPVTRIAFEAGFEAHESFTRAFRAMFGQPPSQFRKVHQALRMPEARSGVHYSPDGRVESFEVHKSGGKALNVRVMKLQPKRVAFVRHVGPYDQVGQTWQKLMAWASGKGMFAAMMMPIGLVHDDPEVTPPEKIRYDACLPVGEDFQPEGEVGGQSIAGGEYAVLTHEGPYEELGESYSRLAGEWLPSSGREFRAAPGFEVYLNSPMTSPPEKLMNDIYLPLES